MEGLLKKNTEQNKEKKYLYHKVPDDLKGNIIYPLNELKNIHPDLYLYKAEKYKGREEVMNLIIEGLECKWNDVLFMTAVNPKELKEELIKAGMHPKEFKFFQIDPEKLDLSKTKVFLFKEGTSKKKPLMDKDEYADFKLEDLEKHSIIPEKTKDYFKNQYENKNHPLMFAFIPHILHKGPIDISDFPVITV